MVGPEKSPPTEATLDRVVRLIERSALGLELPHGSTERLRSSSLELFHACGAGEPAAVLAVLHFAAGILGTAAVDLAADPVGARRLIEEIEDELEIPRVALARELLRAPYLEQLPAPVAAEVQLGLLLAFTGVDFVSLWMHSPSGDIRRVSRAGGAQIDEQPTRRLARRLLGSTQATARDGDSLAAIALGAGHYGRAVLIADGRALRADHRVVLLESTLPALEKVLDRIKLDARHDEHERGAVDALERRLARLRFDLHDGPQQDLHLLATDLRLFCDQLRANIAAGPNTARLLGRLDDLEAQLIALDGDLRRISTSLQSPFLPPGQLSEALKQITDAFSARSGIDPQTRLVGDLSNLSDSQQITLLALVRESLSNILKHSGARSAQIEISAHAGSVEAQVTDDGCGFDPQTTLVRAAREGHLGLVGIHERVRMLGGEARIESRYGGPTTVSIRMPAWQANA